MLLSDIMHADYGRRSERMSIFSNEKKCISSMILGRKMSRVMWKMKVMIHSHIQSDYLLWNYFW